MRTTTFLIGGGGLLGGLILGAFTAPARRQHSSSLPATTTRNSSAMHSATEGRLARAKSFVGDPADLRDLAELGRTLEKLDSVEVAELLDWIEIHGENASGSAQGQLARIFEWWLERDPNAARTWLQPRLILSSEDGPLGVIFESSERGSAITAWAKKDPQGAFDFAREHPHSGLATELLRAAIANWPDASRSTKLAVLQNFPESPARLAATKQLFGDWSREEPVGALAAARQLSSAEERDNATNAVFAAWPKKQATAALDEYQRLGLSDPRLLSKLVGELAAKDLPRTLAWLQELPPQQMNRVGAPIVAAWAERDPGAALGWMLENGISFRGRSQIESTSSHAAFQLQGSFGSGGGKIADPLEVALTTHPEATIDWILSVPDEAQRNRLLTQVINAPGDPDRSLRLFQELSLEYAAQAAWRITATQFGADPGRGSEWAAGLPPGPVRDRAWRGLGSTLAQPPENLSGPDRDAFLTGAVLSNIDLMNRPAAERLDPLLQIQDPVRRRDVFETAMQEMTRGSANYRSKEARAWVEQATIPEEWKRAWRE